MNINSLMDSVGCNVIMITDKYNLRYITGFRGGEGTALILRDKGYLLVDSRYTEAAGREVKEKKDAAVSFEVIEFNNAQPKYKLAAEIILSLNEAVTIGFEDRSMLCYELEAGKEGIAAALREYFPEKKESAGEGFISWKPLGDLIERERRIKTPEELKLLRKAEAIGDKAFSFGGVCGWRDGTLTLTNVLILSQYNTAPEPTSYPSDVLSRNGCTVNNVYYAEQSLIPGASSRGTQATDAQLTSGEICYKLNDGRQGEDAAWYQTLGEDIAPVLDKTHKVVLYDEINGYHNMTKDEEDAIESLTPTLPRNEGAIYNLSGQRVSKAQKGLYIVDGKKIFVK